MRDPKRLDALYANLKSMHKNEAPDIRFGQLVENLRLWLMRYYGKDIFYIEDNRLSYYLTKYFIWLKTGEIDE